MIITKKDAKFSDCGKYRYYLQRVWNDQLPSAMCIGLNPSTANAEEDDPTIRNLCELLSKCGFGSLYMLNLFALISSDPEDLRKSPVPVGEENDQYLEKFYLKSDVTIFCWGSFKQAEYRAKIITKKFAYSMCFGRTSTGKPIHPLAATSVDEVKNETSKLLTNHPHDNRKAALGL